MSGFGERLQYLINRKNFSQQAIADHLGCHRSLISKWISYKDQKPRHETVKRIADLFGCDITWLATGEGEPFPPPKTETAERKSEFVERRQADRADETLALIRRERFKQKCSAYLDELFDFVADLYGEDRDAVDDFLEKLEKLDPDFRVWRAEKKRTRANSAALRGGAKIANNGK